MVETLTALRDPPELLGRIEQADRAELYQALGLTVRYRRIGTTEEVKLTSTLQSVDLKRAGGGTRNNALRPFEASPAWGSPQLGRRVEGNPVREVAITDLWLPAA